MRWLTGRMIFAAGALAVTALAAIALLAGGGSQPATAAGPAINAVALEGDPAPGAGAGRTFQAFCTANAAFDEPMTNSKGDVAFFGCLSDDGWGLYVKPNGGALTLIARDGDSTSAGTLPFDFRATDGPVLNDLGTVAFAIRGAMVDSSTNAIFVKPNTGSLEAVLKGGDAAPCNGCTFVRFDDMAINNGGDLAFIAVYTDATKTMKTGAFLRLADGTVQAVLLAGDTLPGTHGAIFTGVLSSATDEVLLDGPWINDSRNVAFVTDFGDPAAAFEGSVFIKPYGQPVEPFVLIGDPVPASAGGGTIEHIAIGRPALTNGNVLGFNLGRGGSAGSGTAENLIVTKALGGSISSCLADLTPAPGGGTFEGFNAPATSQSGALAFAADINNGEAPVTHGVFLCSGGTTTAVALEAQPTKPRGGIWSSELEEQSIGGSCVVFLDERSANADSLEGVFSSCAATSGGGGVAVQTATPTSTSVPKATATSVPPTATPTAANTVLAAVATPRPSSAVLGTIIRAPNTGSGGATGGSRSGQLPLLAAGAFLLAGAGGLAAGVGRRLRRRA